MPQLLPLTCPPEATVRLYCLPPAGAGPGTYRAWAELLPPTVEAYAVALPGRGHRHDEPPFTDLAALTGAIAALTDTGDPRPYALFGHSLGALLAYETARRLHRTGRRVPDLVALSALPAPHRGDVERLMGTLFAEGANSVTGMLGPVAPELFDDPVTLARVCAPVLADMLLIVYHRHHDEPPLDTALALYGGESDPLLKPAQLEAWNDLFTAAATPRLFPGDHAYVQREPAALVARLVDDLHMATK